MGIPDGFFINGMILFETGPAKTTYLAKGFYLDVPDLSGSSSAKREEFVDQIKIVLGMVDSTTSLQVQWSVDSDYRVELDNYRKFTDEKCKNRFTKYIRSERYRRYLDAVNDGRLRRERLALFFTMKADLSYNKFLGLKEHMTTFLRQMERNLNEKIETVGQIMNQAKIKPMDDMDHYKYYKRFLNPSLAMVPDQIDWEASYDPNGTIQENCLFSDFVTFKENGEASTQMGSQMDAMMGRSEPLHARMDDFYHSIIVLKRWPRTTYAGLITMLTNAVSLNYSITQNIYPLDITREIKKEEAMIERLQGDAANNGKVSLYQAIAKKNTKIASLMAGYTVPFNVLTVIRVWDRTQEGLTTKCASIKTTLQNMNGAQYHQCNHPEQLKNLYFETWPGWTGGKVRDWDMYAESEYLGDLTAVSSSFTGHVMCGESLYDGGKGSLVGVRTFSGETPQHALLIGMAGAGKTFAVIDLLTQSECFYDYTAIIEEGLSYAIWTQTMGCMPIILHPDSAQTINYFDTLQSPLSGLNMSAGVALCLKMIGSSGDEDTNNQRASMIGEYISQLYTDAFDDWKGRNEDKLDELTRFAFAMEEHRKNNLAPGSSSTEAYVDLRDMARNQPEAYENALKRPTEDDVVRFSKNQVGQDLVRNLAYAFFEPEQFPTHTSLVEMMRYGRMPHHKKDDTDYMSSLLSAWCRGSGKNGPLFDGVTNINLTGRVTHFELGLIPESNKELKEAAGFLVANFVRQKIVTMPRAMRKRLVFEEMVRFLGVKGGDKIVSESYAQMRKFGCWVISIVQQYAQFQHSPLRPILVGNSKMFLIMKQNDRRELLDLASDIGLPDTAQHTILDYRLPEHQNPRDRASFYTVMALDGATNPCGTVKCKCDPVMIYVASSNGSLFDKRAKALARYPDVIDGIFAEALGNKG